MHVPFKPALFVQVLDEAGAEGRVQHLEVVNNVTCLPISAKHEPEYLNSRDSVLLQSDHHLSDKDQQPYKYPSPQLC